jgi:hypothetical protein
MPINNPFQASPNPSYLYAHVSFTINEWHKKVKYPLLKPPASTETSRHICKPHDSSDNNILFGLILCLYSHCSTCICYARLLVIDFENYNIGLGDTLLYLRAPHYTDMLELHNTRQMLELHTKSSSSKVGTLMIDGKKLKTASVLHRKTNGDTLVYDGMRILMLKAHCVVDDSKTRFISFGKKRLLFVKKLYAKLLSGELDYQVLYMKIKKQQYDFV